MPPSERVRKHILDWFYNDRHRIPYVQFVDFDDEENNDEEGVFNKLRDEEFDGINRMLEYRTIKYLSFIGTTTLIKLPPLPTQLKSLTLSETGIRELSPLPNTLDEIEIVNNKNIILPSSLPSNLRQITIIDNNLRELPSMPNINEDMINIQESNLQEPFLSIYNKWKTAMRMPYANRQQLTRTFFEEIRAVWEQRKRNARARGRNTRTALLSIGQNTRLPPTVSQEITSYFSGKPAYMTPNEQLASKRNNYRKLTRRRKGRVSRKTRHRR